MINKPDETIPGGSVVCVFRRNRRRAEVPVRDDRRRQNRAHRQHHLHARSAAAEPAAFTAGGKEQREARRDGDLRIGMPIH
jgi:hypothetical protein